MSDRVQRVEVRAPGEPRELRLAENGRAFLAVLPADADRDTVLLRFTYEDGRTEDVASPRRLNIAPLNWRQATLLAPITARYDRHRAAVVISTRISHPPKLMRVTFLGRGLRLRREGSSDRYSAVYVATHGKYRRRVKAGRTVDVSYVLYSPNCFAARFSTVTIRSSFR